MAMPLEIGKANTDQQGLMPGGWGKMARFHRRVCFSTC